MKYIKRFIENVEWIEEHKKFYQKISEHEFNNSTKHIDIDIIVSQLNDGYEVRNFYKKELSIRYWLDSSMRGRWELYQCDDEWFYLSKEVRDINSSPYNESFTYYKCDQLEGVILLLKTEGVIE